MKLYTSILITLFLYSLYVNGENKKIKDIDIIPIEANIVGDSVKLKMIINIPKEHIKLCSAIVLTPVIVYENIRDVLPEIVLAGRNIFALMQRDSLFSTLPERDEKLLFNYNTQEFALIKGVKRRTGIQVIYEQTVLYSKWLEKSKIEIFETLMRCNKEIITELKYIGNQININHQNK